MIKIMCRTNLDLEREQFPTELPCVPRKGDYVESSTLWHNGFRLVLEVANVTWRYSETIKSWYAEVELHDRKVFNRSIYDFYEWYAPKIGKTVSYFV